MSLIRLSFKHDMTVEEARTQLEKAIGDVRSQLGAMVRRVDWSADGDQVVVTGLGFRADLGVDAQEVHVRMEVPVLAKLLGKSFEDGLKGILQKTFHKQLN